MLLMESKFVLWKMKILDIFLNYGNSEILELFREETSPENLNFTVWDPFCGTGTTGVACAKFGMKFLGSDKDRLVFNVAFRRVHDSYLKTGK